MKKKKHSPLPSMNELNRLIQESIASVSSKGGVEVLWSCLNSSGEERMTIHLDRPTENVDFYIKPKLCTWADLKRALTSRGIVPLDIGQMTVSGMKCVTCDFAVDRSVPVIAEQEVCYYLFEKRIDFAQRLNEQLDQAVREENFEVAARLRDMINASTKTATV